MVEKLHEMLAHTAGITIRTVEHGFYVETLESGFPATCREWGKGPTLESAVGFCYAAFIGEDSDG